MNMKYVVMETALNESPIIFPAWMNHNDVARNLPGHAISAGEFCLIPLDEKDDGAIIVANKFEVQCFGESTTLKLKPRPEDAPLIHRMFRSALTMI